jgi:uncharacterized membrane protein YqjE
MNMQTATVTTDRGLLHILLSMVGTRLELAAIDVETHAQATLNAMLLAFVATVLGLIAFAFAGMAVIVFFWDTHRIAAAAGVTGSYVLLAALLAWRAHVGWRSRPAAFSGLLRELALDRETFGRRP